MSPSLFNIGWRYLLRRPWQSILMILGITLGVAVVVSVDLANASAERAFELSTASIVGQATHQITGGPQGIPEEVFAALRREGIRSPMAPTASAYVASEELGGLPMQLLGVDPFSEAPFRSYLAPSDEGTSFAGLTPLLTQPNTVLISTDLADNFGIQPCSGAPNPACTITLQFSGYAQDVYVVGLLDPTDNLSRRALSGLILADISTAQELTNQTGFLTTIDLILEENQPGASTDIEGLLPADLRLSPIGARTGTVSQMTEAFRVNLTALSLLALVVGLFLIYNTMTFSVVQRRPLFGTLRCIGVTRREVFILVVSEAFVAGLVGSVLGLGLGILLGQGTVQLVTQTINDLYFVVTVRGIDVQAASLVKGALLGIGATVIAAAFPAWEAASVPPRAALSRSGLERKASGAVRFVAVLGAVLIAGGLVTLNLPTKNLAISFAGTFAVIIGFAMLTPITTTVFMRFAAPVTGAIFGVLGKMAPRDVTNSLSRTSIAVAALMVAVSVTIGVSVMIGSFRNTVVIWLEQTLQGDVYVSPAGAGSLQSISLIDPEAVSIIRAEPGIDRVDTLVSGEIDSPDGPVRVAATENPDLSSDRLFLSQDGTNEEIMAALEAGGILVSEPLANRLDIPLSGGRVTLFTDSGPKDFPVSGIYYDYASSQGTVLMTQEVFGDNWGGSDEVNAIALRLEEGADPDAVAASLLEKLTPIQQLDIRPNRALREETLVIFDRTFAITSALQILATTVAFIGVLSALLSLQLEKARELGVLRAVGLTVRQLWGLVMLETGLMGGVAGLLAMPTGFVLSLILIYIINRRAFGWTLQLSIEPAPFIQAFFIALVAALLAGIYPARKIGKMATSEALRGD